MLSAILLLYILLHSLVIVAGQRSINDLVVRRPQSATTNSAVPAALPTGSRAAWSWNRRTLKDWKLSDIAIVATLDGSLHALERESGETRWTIASADATIKSIQAATYNDSVLDGQRDTWIVEPIDDGCLYTFNTKEGLYKLPFGIKQLVENSPFTVPGDDKVYVGERRTTLYSIDPKNGNVLQAYGSGFGYTSTKAPKCPTRDSLDELDDDHECTVADLNAKDILKIGRNTYTLTVFNGAATLWNVTYTEWVPNTIDVDLERQYAGTFDGKYISPLYDGKIIAHQTETNDAVWFRDLTAPAVRVYDVLHQQAPSTRGSPPEIEAVALVAQPLDPHFAESGHENYVDGDGSTYVGKTEAGDWFALSASKCPLVSGAPLSRWSAGTGVGSADDLLGIHTHNRLTNQQPESPGHLLTIEDATPETKLITDNTSSTGRSIGKLLLTCLTIFMTVYFIVRRRVKTHPATVDRKSISGRPADGSDLAQLPTDPIIPRDEPLDGQEVSLSVEKALPDLPLNSETIEPQITAPVAESPTKAKRKRGSRGGKKVREAAQKAADEEAEGSENKDPATLDNVDAPTIIKTMPAKPLPGVDSTYPLQINSLSVTDKILGYGSHGTIVYQGSFEGRDVAVKRMLLDFYDIASHEVVLLQESDDHPNVIRYYCKQENERFLYIALELCTASLAEVTERPNEFQALIDTMNDVVSIIQQMALGIQYLHSLKIVHRDLKPQNILVNPPRKSIGRSTTGQCARLVISDFGLCKKLDADQSSFRATTAQAAGTTGWRAPELLVDDCVDVSITPREGSTSESTSQANGTGTPRKVSRAIDIFSLGCVFYYVLSNGAHPFGDRYMREANIIRNRFNLDHLDLLGDIGVLAKDLIGQMILQDPKARPDATTVLRHPFFWNAERRLNFLLDVSDRFEIEERDPPSPLLLMLESGSSEVVNDNWYAKLDRNFIDNLGKYRKYNGASILDLLRALRNKKHHYQDLPENVQNALGSVPSGFLNYFCGRFPLLLLHAYYLAKAELAHEPMFAAYFNLQ